MTHDKRAVLYALAAVLGWSTVATAFKLTLRVTDPAATLFYSSLFSTILLFAIDGARRNRVAIHPVRDFRSAVLPSALNGFLNPFLYYLVLFKAYSLLPAQEAQPLNYTWPIVLLLLSAPMLGHRLRVRDIASSAISFAGVLVIAGRGDFSAVRVTNLPGALLALGSSVIWAFYWLRNMKDQREIAPKLALNFFFGFLYVSIYLALRGCRPPFTAAALAGCAWIGIFEMGFTFFVWMKAIGLARRPAVVSNLVFLAPFLSLIPIHFVVGEKILPSSVAGLSLIVAGILAGKRNAAPRFGIRNQAPCFPWRRNRATVRKT